MAIHSWLTVLGIRVNFFHLDCLASEVRLNVDLDAVLTVLANGCYRWLGRRLRGYEKAAPKQLYPMFGVRPPRSAAGARENPLFSRPFARGGPLPARKV